jgi:DNA topoisomerase-1
LEKTSANGQTVLLTDPVTTAKSVGLRYVSDSMPGIRRRRVGKTFRFIDAEGKPVRDAQTLARIRSLVIPPAWEEVWICPIENGHIQATARDARGRKQYRYHARWRAVRDETKYERMIGFIGALPAIRKRVKTDLALTGMPREKVLAAVVHLLETTYQRVGNKEYARDNKSFGLTTLRNEHVQVSGAHVRFSFRGKSGKWHSIELDDPRLARIVRRCRDMPGYELFEYMDETGTPRDIDAADVNAYLREISGEDYTAKDFRTWGGTMLAALALRGQARPMNQTRAKSNVVNAVKAVAEKLGNTPSICRKCYVHPIVITSYLDGTLWSTAKPRRPGTAKDDWTRREELELVSLLQQHMETRIEPPRDAAKRAGRARNRPRQPARVRQIQGRAAGLSGRRGAA